MIHSVAIPFDTDEADHANPALELFYAVTSHSLTNIYHAITRQAFYPPLNSFFVALSYRIFAGPSLFASRLPEYLFLIGSICFTAVAGCRIGLKAKESLVWIWATIALLYLESPVIQENSSLCMLEMLGVLITAMMLYAATLPSRKTQLWSLSTLGFLLTLTKYSFAVMIVPSVFLWMLLTSDESKLFTKIKNISLPIFSYLVATIAWVMTTRTDSVLKFFTSHPSYAPLLSAENIFFDLRSWVFYYQALPIIGAVCAALFIVSLFIQRPATQIRLSQLMAANSVGLLLLSSTNEVRHFIVAAPPLWLIAVYVLSHPLLTVTGYLRMHEFKQVLITGLEGKVEYNDMINALIKNTDLSKPTLLMGTFDQVGIEAIQWYAAKEQSKPYTEMDFDLFPYREDKNVTQKIRSRNIDKWFIDPTFPKDLHGVLHSHHYETLAMIRNLPSHSDTDKTIASIVAEYPNIGWKKKVFADKELIVGQLKDLPN